MTQPGESLNSKLKKVSGTFFDLGLRLEGELLYTNLMQLLLSFFIGVLSGAFSSLVGGAAGTISAPLLLFIGLPPYTAISTTKMGSIGIAFGSIGRFYRTKYIKWALTPPLIIVAIIAAVTGAGLLLKTPEHFLHEIIAILLLLSVALLHSHEDVGVAAFTVSKFKKLLGHLFFFFSEMFRAAFGSGFGMLTNIIMVRFFGLTMLESTATKRVTGLLVSVVALVIFLTAGVVDVAAGASLFVGTMLGSYIGTHYAIKLGDKWVKSLFTVFAVVMAVILVITS